MTQTIQLAHNAVMAKLINADREAKALVSKALSYLVEGHEHMHAFTQGGWNGRSSFFTHSKASFPAGFAHMVRQVLADAGYKVQMVRRPLPEPLGPENPIVDEFGNDDPRYDYQMRTVEQLLRHGRGIAQIATGGGKCLGKDTPVMMFDGTIKMVQDVQTGDLLMGPDSTPRRVLSTTKGRSKLYRVTPTKGDAYVVNDAHILSLKKTSRGYRGRNRDGEKYPKGEIVNINVEKYLAENKTFRHVHKGWRTGVDFKITSPLLVDPYFLGLLLGDGSINGTVSLTTADAEIVAEVKRQAGIWGLKVMPYSKTQSNNAAKTYYLTAGRTGGKINPLMAALRSVGLGLGEKGKFIPHAYKTASRKDRLALLAGVLDTDGYYDGKGFYLTLKDERLMDDVLFVARSLGFACYKKRVRKTCVNNGKIGDYFTASLSGPLEIIPVRLERRKAAPRIQKKDPLMHGLSIEDIGMGDYYGFEIDGDHLFLLGDFTVTHNTKVAKLAVARIRRMTLFLTTRGVLMHQMADSFREAGYNVGIIGDGEWRATKGVNCAMVQTLVAHLAETTIEAERRAVVKQIANKELDLDMKQVGEIAKERFQAHMARRARTIKFLEMVEFVIGEEAHEAGGNSYYEILRHCKNAHYRLALTATPFMRANAEDNMRLMAAFGPILIKVSEKLLIDRGILATPYFRFVHSQPHDKLRKSSPWQRALQLGYTENPYMTADIVGEARKAADRNLPVMTLVQRKAHGVALKKAMKAAGLRVEFIQGENDQAGRRRALTKLGKGEIDVLIGTTILDVGVDVPAVSLVQLAGGGKAEVATRQRIGRGLRAKKKGPNIAFISDYTTGPNNYLSEHARHRRAIIEQTPGFAENILPKNQDFDWALFDSIAV